MIRRSALVLFAALIFHGAADAASPVSGRVTSGTNGVSVPAGLEVFVVKADSEGNELDKQTTTTNADGSFTVPGFDVAEGEALVVGAVFNDVTYSSVVTDTASASLTIFDVTDDPSVIALDAETITVVRGEQDDLAILEIFRFHNSGDRTYIGGNIELPLAQGAFDVVPGQGLKPERLEQTDGALIASEPLVPGDSSLSLLYRVRVARSGWILRRPVTYDTKHVDVLVGEGLELVSGEFEFAENKELGDKEYRRYRGGPFDAGSILGVDISYESADKDPGAGFMIAGGLIIAFIVAAAFALRRRPLKPVTVADRQSLIENIATLDEMFEQGRIPEADYTRRRDSLKKDLLALTERLAK